MAEESIKLSFTREIMKPDKGNPRRNSTGKPSLLNRLPDSLIIYHRASVASCHDVGILKGNSTGQSSSPNYLRASTGSCHEFCKYGKEHSFAVKARNPKIKRMMPPSDKQKNKETAVLAQKKKTSVGKPKPSRDIKIHSPEQNIRTVVLPERKKTLQVKLKPSPDLIHSPEPPEIIKREIFLPSKKGEVSLKQNSSNNKIMKDKEMKTTSTSKYSPAPKSKSVTVGPSASSTTSVGLNDTRKPSTKPKMAGTSKTAVKKVLAPPTASLTPKPSGSKTYTSMSLKDRNKTRKAESKIPENEKVQEKTLHVVEAETENKNLESVQGDGTIEISPSLSLQSPKSLSHPGSRFLSSHRNKVEEFEYIDREDLQQSEYTDIEDLEESEYTENETDEFVSENDEIVNIKEVDTSKGNHNQSPKEGGATRFEDEDSALARSKFKRGRIVDLQSENNVPRRLRFRRGRVVGDNDDSNSYARRRNFKKREVGDEANGASPGSEKVVLRHQYMQGKKDAQVLFNNVIEETAGKLVESRKSKVKALVGAFETVISLQETKPSTPTGT